jgi:hypothetical protein
VVVGGPFGLECLRGCSLGLNMFVEATCMAHSRTAVQRGVARFTMCGALTRCGCACVLCALLTWVCCVCCWCWQELW